MASDRYRKKPVVIEATRWFKNGDHPDDDTEVIHGKDADFESEGKVVRYFRHPNVLGTKICEHETCARTMHDHGWIDTLEGGHTVCPGDWVITGVKGERYPCKPGIFDATYDEIEDLTEPDDGITEHCATCGRGYMLWHSPDPLWQELIGHYGGTRCPRCFDQLATERGITLVWTPVVMARGHFSEPTTNWWGDPIRDRLLMGEPDPHYHDNKRAQVPQGHWGEIAQALGWPYETPYPDENREDTMPGVVYRDSGVNAEAEPAAPDGISDLVTEVRLTQLPAPARRKRIRVDAGVSARKAARALGVDVMTLVRWEQGATPRPEHAIPYRRLLDGLEEVTS